jgi:aldehyde:ferredoxin oxidoreductase
LLILIFSDLEKIIWENGNFLHEMGFYSGKILWVDLSKGTVNEEVLDDSIYHQYLGGYGLGVRLLYERIPAGADPLGPDNVLGFVEGLLTGSVVPFTGRYMIVGKSPLTGGWGDSNSGGYFGPEIRKCGYDGIFFQGISPKPVYLVIQEGKATLEDASSLWGLDAVEADDKLQEIHGKKTKVAAIGQAGENVCLNAGIVNDRGRIAARSGLGAVMGSKKLKALALIGHNKVEYDDKKALMGYVQAYNKRMKKNIDSKLAKTILKVGPKFAGLLRKFKMPMFSNTPMATGYFNTYGTSFSTAISAEIGDSPIKNWGGVGYLDFPQKKARNLAGPNILNWKVKPYGCFACPVRCGAICSVPELNLEETHRPEYETLSTFGSLILNGDLIKIFEINEYLNRTGLDSISAGGIVAFAIECFENGILTEKETDGLILKWGETDFLMPLLQKIVNREGIGKILADGVKLAAEKIGKGSEKYAIHANGQELAMHDPKHTPSLGATYVADPTPGRHTAASVDFMEVGPIDKFIKGFTVPKSKRYVYNSKGIAQAKMTKIHQSLNSLGFCLFGPWNGRMELIQMMKAVLGWKISIDDLIHIGARIQTLRQLFNSREGAVKHFIHSRAVGNPAQVKGPLKGITLDTKQMVKDYYSEMNWNPETGIPTEATIKFLELDSLVSDLNPSSENDTIAVLDIV